jgi:dienelactone hydrolase
MFRKQDVRFPAEGGIELSAWLFVPERQAGRLPAITMAHGCAGTKYHGIEPMAAAFAEAGFVVLLHDHRGFGGSGGEPRQDINPWQQITDWRRGLCGTSYAGGHAIVLGATDRRLKAVVAKVPTIDGYASGLPRVAPEVVADLEALFAADERAQPRGEPPATQAIVSADAARAAAYKAADAVSSTFVRCRTASGRTRSPSGRRGGPACTLPATSSNAYRLCRSWCWSPLTTRSPSPIWLSRRTSARSNPSGWS